jgi:deoxyribose-phosphate aldolase
MMVYGSDMSDTASVLPPQPVETYESLSRLVDSPLLEPALSSEQVERGCRLAREYGIRAVILRPCDMELAAPWMRGSSVAVVGAAGHPDGTSTTGAKLFEARDLLRLGANEVEFVLNPARIVSRQFQHVETELMQISKSCHESGARLTIVMNNRWFADDLKIIATKICKRIEVDVLAVDHSEADLNLLRPLLKDVLRLKRATRVDSLDDALAAREAGYSSFNCSDPGTLLEAWKQRIAPPSRSQS